MFTVLRWETRFASGIASLDFRHQVLFALINEVNCAALTGDRSLSPREMLADFARHARLQFAEEEQLKLASGYSELESHRMEHGVLCEAIALLAGAESEVDVVDVCAFAHDWLVRHIVSTDLPMAAYLRGDIAA